MEFFQLEVTTTLVAFARIGTALMFLPGFGEMRVPGRHRLALGLILAMAMAPLVPMVLPDKPVVLALLLGKEALIGLYLGLGGRILFAALHVLGTIVAQVSSLSNAMAAGDSSYEGSTAISSLLTVAGVALVFLTDLHHLMLRGLWASYEVMPPAWVPLGDLAEAVVKLAARSLYIAALLAAPFHIMAVVLNLGLGLANRVMPAMPVFMVLGPVLVMMGLFLFMLAQPALLSQFFDLFAEFFMDYGR